MVDAAGNLQEFVRLFTEIALGDPLSAVLLAGGSILLAVSVGIVGYLALGAVVDAIIPDSSGAQHRRGQ